jgi:ribosome-associated protein
MPGDLQVTSSVLIPEAELSWRFSRSSGPGGQGVNTTDSRVELLWDVAATSALGPTLKARALERLADRLVEGTVLSVTASEQRSQYQNRLAAERRLVDAVAAAIAPPPRPRRPTRPTRGSVDRRIAEKKRRGETKRLRRGDAD